MMPDRYEEEEGINEDARRRALEQLAAGPGMDPGLARLRSARAALDSANAAAPVPVAEGLPMPTYRPLSGPRTTPGTTPPRASESAPASRRLPKDDEMEAAMDASRQNALGAGLGMAGAMASAALTRRKVDARPWEGLEKSALSPVQELVAKRAAAAESAKAAKQAALADPNSPESIRFRTIVKNTLPGVYTDEELSHLTAADEDGVLKYGSMRQSIDARREAAKQHADALEASRQDRLSRDKQHAQEMGYRFAELRQRQADSNAQREADRQLRRDLAAQKADATPKGTVVPGLEVAPGAAPTAEDAKKVKASMASAERMRAYVKELRDLHTKAGTEYVGADAVRMGQLTKAIQLEAKNIAELGALSGPDMELMQSIAGTDPTSLGANVKAMFGSDNTDTALDGLEKWTGDQLNASQKTYGYQPKAGAAARPDVDLSAPADDMVRVVSPSGQAGSIPRANLQKALSKGYREST